MRFQSAGHFPNVELLGELSWNHLEEFEEVLQVGVELEGAQLLVEGGLAIVRVDVA